MAAVFLVGEHDYSSFAVNPKREIGSHVCHVVRLDVCPVGDFVYFDVVGNRFLYKMVRGLVGYLVHVGLGRACAEDARRVLAQRDRAAAADSAPAHGLFLARVFFREGDWDAYRPALPPFA